MPRADFRFDDMLRMNAEGYFPYTPPTPLMHGMRAALDRLFAEGLDAVIERHARLAEGVRQGVLAWGLDLVAEHRSLWSNTVTAIRTPRDVDARDVISLAYANYNTSFGAGLGPLAGKVFRIGHLGDLNEVSCLAALGAAEMALADAGVALEPGSGVAAAQRVYRAAREERAFALAAE
jgi:alanine-glyoxylate transaminase/serine-glyoxylate transaminase/serine-pyruvate transaminase